MNLPNKLTLLRLILVPFYIFFLLCEAIPYNWLIALIIFIAASITDKLDGTIARKYNLVSTFGKFMDPLADKFLVIAALMGMVELGVVSSVAAYIIVARELLVTGIRLLAVEDGVVIAANNLGKAKTVTQMIAIIMLSLYRIPLGQTLMPVSQAFLWVSVVLTIVSGWSYVKPCLKYLMKDLK